MDFIRAIAKGRMTEQYSWSVPPGDDVLIDIAIHEVRARGSKKAGDIRSELKDRVQGDVDFELL